MEQVSLPIIFHDEARLEYDEAYDWIQERWPDTADRFETAIQTVLDRISASPRMHACVKDDVRRATVSGFRYYVVYYRERVHDIEVLSVFHTSRDPKTWQDRV